MNERYGGGSDVEGVRKLAGVDKKSHLDKKRRGMKGVCATS